MKLIQVSIIWFGMFFSRRFFFDTKREKLLKILVNLVFFWLFFNYIFFSVLFLFCIATDAKLRLVSVLQNTTAVLIYTDES